MLNDKIINNFIYNKIVQISLQKLWQLITSRNECEVVGGSNARKVYGDSAHKGYKEVRICQEYGEFSESPSLRVKAENSFSDIREPWKTFSSCFRRIEWDQFGVRSWLRLVPTTPNLPRTSFECEWSWDRYLSNFI